MAIAISVEMVFAVSPMNTPGDYVHPLAETFMDFLRLLLACGNTDALEQAHQWDQQRFDTFLQENPMTEEQKVILSGIEEKCGLTPMEAPFGYLKRIQAEFDYRRLKFKPEYAEWAPEEPKVPTPPEWKVCFGAGFFETKGYGRAGKVIQIDKHFAWGGSDWYIPAVYICSGGVVMDICVEATAERITAFMKKWRLHDEYRANGIVISDEERELIEHENPLNIDIRATLTLNGLEMRMTRGCGESWIPECCLPEDFCPNSEAGWIVEHYGLDKEKAYGFYRASFPWSNGKKTAINSMEAVLEVSPTSLPGIHFHTPVVGEVLSFTHLITGCQHTMTIESVEPQALSDRAFYDPQYEFPGKYIQMRYALSPDISDRNFSVRDCLQNDQPRRKTLVSDRKDSESDFASSLAIIGGADGPTAIFVAGISRKSGDKERVSESLHMACSALRFEPVDDVEWRVEFREKLREDIKVTLL